MGGDRKIESVAIIGAGAAGAITAAALKAEDYFEKIRVFERRESAGGTWIYDPNPTALPPLQPGLLPPDLDPPLKIPTNLPRTEPHDSSSGAVQERYSQTPIYQSLTTNVPDVAMCFSDSGFAYGPFAPHWVPRQYVEAYFSRHRTDSLLVLDTTVEDASRVSATDRPERWRLTLRRFDRARGVDVWWEEVFDAVVFANGHYSVPFVPKVKGLSEYIKEFPGRVVHSKTYRIPQAFTSKKVLVVGNSASGHDVAAELVGIAAAPVIQSRRSKSRWDGDEPPPGMEWRPVISEFLPDGRIVFADGSVLNDVDRVIYCTGYQPSYPFWNSAKNHSGDSDGDGGKAGRPLWDYERGRLVGSFWHTFFRDFGTLGIVGVPRVLTFRSFEYQAVALARLFSGRNAVALPPIAEQERWERERDEAVAREGRKFHDVPWETGETLEWLAGLFRVAGLPTLRGKGRVPPVISEEMVWALEHVKKYPEPGKGDDNDDDDNDGNDKKKDWIKRPKDDDCDLDERARGQWALPHRPKKDLLSFI